MSLHRPWGSVFKIPGPIIYLYMNIIPTIRGGCGGPQVEVTGPGGRGGWGAGAEGGGRGREGRGGPGMRRIEMAKGGWRGVGADSWVRGGCAG